ncbi:GNAT family N-acetyltransferase [Paenibacillus kobensis]|uniref:GNAT family N-acetyltransferase n=1 Tax=Paenibacillus kobensis TaxID=59841 RepID=UPI0013E38AE2|nr:GNAT family N-acetyltransferase [Paenibacillus kobensis]
MSRQFTIEASESIRLRNFTREDYQALYELTRQTEITDLLPDWNMTEEQLDSFLNFVTGSYDSFDPADVRVLLAVEHTLDNRLIGWCGVFPNDMLKPEAREVAYALSRDYRGRGYMTAAVEAICSYMFEHTELARIVAIVKLYNHASSAVLNRAGFRHIEQTVLSDGEPYEYFELDDEKLRFRRARLEDAETLKEMMVRTFDREQRIWLRDDEEPDANLRPPGYESAAMQRYVIQEWPYYVMVFAGKAVGAISVNVSGRHGRVDKLFIDPDYQGRGFGSLALCFVEKQFPRVQVWKLETSGKQLHNHRFYEKAGFVRTHESEWEFAYEKVMTGSAPDAEAPGETLQVTGSMSGAAVINCSMPDSEFYNVDLSGGFYMNCTLQDSRITDCNLSGTRWTNLNLTNMLMADLRLTGSEIGFAAMDGVRFHDTHLGTSRQPAVFERCDLSGSVIRDSQLSGVHIEQCDVAGMTINGIAVEELLKAYMEKSAVK